MSEQGSLAYTVFHESVNISSADPSPYQAWETLSPVVQRAWRDVYQGCVQHSGEYFARTVVDV